MKYIALFLIKIYQVLISPVIGSNCRYQPTCSHYAAEAIERFGIIRGGWMAVKRISRCHPWHEGGYDPVPEHKLEDQTHPSSSLRFHGSVSKLGLDKLLDEYVLSC